MADFRTKITGTGSYIPELVKTNRDFTIHDFYKINEAIKELEKSKTVCNNCIYANKNMIKDKIVCDIFVSTNRKGTVEKDFGCNKGKTE